jgi:hypothetical protein
MPIEISHIQEEDKSSLVKAMTNLLLIIEEVYKEETLENLNIIIHFLLVRQKEIFLETMEIW